MPECESCKKATNFYALCVICGKSLCPLCFLITSKGAVCQEKCDEKTITEIEN